MWTIDTRCSQCSKKEACEDRPQIIQTLTELVGPLNTKPEYVDGPGDGVLVVACRDFSA